MRPDISWFMPEKTVMASPEANLAAARADLEWARTRNHSEQAELLEALIGSGGSLLIYEPDQRHYAVLFGNLEQAHHVGVMVPGVGNSINLAHDWLPSAFNLYAAADRSAVILWKGYDNPNDLVDAAVVSVQCNRHVMSAGQELTEFVSSLKLRAEQSLTLIAHSFGSIVVGCALADCNLVCTDAVVLGSPGMSVDDLRQLHLVESHFFSEEAPGDAIADLGIFGAAPTSPTFGGTRMRTNAPGHITIAAHSSYFMAGSEALENIVDVVTGRYDSIQSHNYSWSERAGGLVAWTMRIPTRPFGLINRHYQGPGFRVLINARRLIDVTATEAGNLVEHGVDRCLETMAHAADLLSEINCP